MKLKFELSLAIDLVGLVSFFHECLKLKNVSNNPGLGGAVCLGHCLKFSFSFSEKQGLKIFVLTNKK